MGIADAVQLGSLGPQYLAAANQGNNIFFMFCSLTMGVLYAISPLVSIRIGAGEKDKTFVLFRSGLWVALALFMLQLGCMQVCIHYFHWFKQTPEINELAPQYLEVLCWSALPLLLFLVMREYSDGLGFTKIAMYLTFGGLFLNIFINYLLIYGNWGFPRLEVRGAALATLISRIVIMTIGFVYLRKARSFKEFRPTVKLSTAEIGANVALILKMGGPIALQTFAEWGGFAVSGIMIGWLGSQQTAAHAAALSAAAFTYMLVSGIAIAGSIMVGNAYGERNREKIKRTSKVILGLIIAIEIVFALIFLFGNKVISGMYHLHAEVEVYILPLLMLAALFQVADGLQAGAMYMLRGVKDVKWAGAISVISYWVIGIPLSYYLGICLKGEVYGIWIGFTTGLFVAALLGILRFYRNLKTLNFDL